MESCQGSAAKGRSVQGRRTKDLRQSYPTAGVKAEHAAHEMDALRRDVEPGPGLGVVAALEDGLIDLRIVVVPERQVLAQEHVQDDPQGPHIRLHSVRPRQHLRRHVVGAASVPRHALACPRQPAKGTHKRQA